MMTVEVGVTVRGTVVKVTDYGAIVRLPEGKSGLIHISEIADAYVRDIREVRYGNTTKSRSR